MPSVIFFPEILPFDDFVKYLYDTINYANNLILADDQKMSSLLNLSMIFCLYSPILTLHAINIWLII